MKAILSRQDGPDGRKSGDADPLSGQIPGRGEGHLGPVIAKRRRKGVVDRPDHQGSAAFGPVQDDPLGGSPPELEQPVGDMIDGPKRAVSPHQAHVEALFLIKTPLQRNDESGD